jgi:hypothetical protein
MKLNGSPIELLDPPDMRLKVSNFCAAAAAIAVLLVMRTSSFGITLQRVMPLQ